MIPFLAYEAMAEKAEQFLEEQAGTDEPPVDIEAIIEFKLGMEIIPMPWLQRDHGMEGAISADLTCIYVDQGVLETVPVRYRFTLAHEVGHRVLHADVIREHWVSSVAQWKRAVSDFDNRDYQKMEFQGYAFGGLVLVPPQPLRRLFDARLCDLEAQTELARANGLSRPSYLDYAIEEMASWLAPEFDVSAEVVARRIRHAGLERDIP